MAKTKLPGTGANRRDTIIDAMMALLAESRFEEIGVGDVAARAGLSLADLRDEFNSTGAIIAAFSRRIDKAVLSEGGSDMAEETPRERLFDVLMRRLEKLGPDKEAIRSLVGSARCNPALALALNGLAVNSLQWMMSAADIDPAGTRGMIRAQGLSCLYARVMRVWLRDDDPGLARTMAALDRELARGASWSRLLDDLCRLVPSASGRRRRPRHAEDGTGDVIV